MRKIIVNNSNIDLSFFRNFDSVEEKMSFKLIGLKDNKEYLEDIPYRRFEDLAMVPICMVRNSEIGVGHITIRNSHLDLWGITYDRLWKNLMENSTKTAEVKIKTMPDFLGEDYINDFEVLQNIIIVSNKEQNYGAGAVLYPGVLEKISDKYGKNLYVLPASVHEVLVLPEQGEENEAEMLEAIVRQVNAGVLSKEDFLSDKIYYYEKTAGILAVCE
ncbi:hypothetical protein SAMN02910451_02642 [Butyrivibrio hungatei]|uniref:Uncharacterized protein n=1 Tax=Butyrivibrio hungatei TaxID=185008 RepID=A0A1G5FZL1_9FIRM|nr:DUF5688 family protein [Butyrivibrio hungatei]MEE3469789.1 DUF5688 family protein [Butyrivibrio hungatei]SCY44644.1 hypothetical protein SAMN02910451_02642 [Butyrivibrio hungatei]